MEDGGWKIENCGARNWLPLQKALSLRHVYRNRLEQIKNSGVTETVALS